MGVVRWVEGLGWAVLLGLPALHASVRVDEGKSKAVLRDGSTVVALAVSNSAKAAVKAEFQVEWLDLRDVAVASVRKDFSVAPGAGTVEIPLPLPDSSLWTRLRYRVTPALADPRAFVPDSGVVALPVLADYVFEASASFSGDVRGGGPLTFHARAVHPVSLAAVAEVEWEAELDTGDEPRKPLRVTRLEGGFVEFVFDGSGLDDSPQFAATGRRGDFEQKVRLQINPNTRMTARIQCDKPIYQPGQTIRFRAVVLAPDGKAMAGAKVRLEISDEDDEEVHAKRLTASKFGVVQDEWTLPASARPGAYRIVLNSPDERNSHEVARHVVRVSRYELPAFRLEAKPDRGAYLPGQSARMTIGGVYLFGKPVPKGKVKVVRSDDSEDVVAEGVADDGGIFHASVELKADHVDLSASRDRFRDVSFAAYYTDPGSGKTEQRRFDIRVTREPLHVYLHGARHVGPVERPLYVSVYHADGRPAEAMVEIRGVAAGVQVRTNRYGVGKVLFATGSNDPETILVTARTASGETGTYDEKVYPAAGGAMRIDTERTLHRVGEPVTLGIVAPPGDHSESVIVLAMAEGVNVANRAVRLTGGKATVTFPYQPEFRRKVTFTAVDLLRDSRPAAWAKTVIFPDSSEVTLTAAPDKATYKPGDAATLTLKASTKGGQPVEAAVGLAIVDQAVFERARTGEEFGGRQRPWFFCHYCQDPGEVEVGGVRLNDLFARPPSAPFSAELDLAAEVLVLDAGAPWQSNSGERLEGKPRSRVLETQMLRLKEALDRHWAEHVEFPRDLAELVRMAGRAWSGVADPWGEPYTAEFGIEYANYTVSVRSTGPDKKPGTRDDFQAEAFRRPYFAPFQSFLANLLKKEGDYPVSPREFEALLAANGIAFGTLRDPWGTPYSSRVTTYGATRWVEIRSAGRDGVRGTEDDVPVAHFAGRYFQREIRAINAAVRKEISPPRTIDDFKGRLEKAGIDIASYRDSWNGPYRLEQSESSGYGDRLKLTTIRTFGGETANRTSVVPVTRKFLNFHLRSGGPDGIPGNHDDFAVATFSFLLEEEGAGETTAPRQQAARGSGSIRGSVLDPTGGVIPDVSLALLAQAGTIAETTSGPDGFFEFEGLADGAYAIKAAAPGFANFEMNGIPVRMGKATAVEIVLQVGSTAQTVAVEEASPMLQTETAMAAAAGSGEATGTPRVREYFPETLLWLPEMVTGANGQARAAFTLADSVTMWKAAAIASTADGRFASAEIDIHTFQPFFLDFDPPPVLTQGDRVEMPVTVRNYLTQARKVDVRFEPGDWAAVEGPSKKAVTVAANGSVNASYRVHAKTIRDKAVQRVIARAGREGDAIEKATRVRPDGQEIAQSTAELTPAAGATFPVTIPANAIRGASRAELKVYPNIPSMLFESAAAIEQMPGLCMEQRISAGYANLVAWRFARAAGINDARASAAALERVRGTVNGILRNPDHGVPYWHGGESSIAVTAHALTFLAEASSAVEVNPESMRTMVAFLEGERNRDGTWSHSAAYWRGGGRYSTLLTAVVARALAAARKAGVQIPDATLSGAYHHLASVTDQMDESYMLAQFVLAVTDSGDVAVARDAAVRLAALSHEERGALYWDLRTNSPFYGWGSAGREETTGLAVSALSAWLARHPNHGEFGAKIRRGLMFLLRGRRSAGYWYSTQSTVRAMAAIADAAPVLGPMRPGNGNLVIRANGRLFKTIPIPDAAATDPVAIDVSSALAESNTEFVVAPGAGGTALVHLTSSYWLPWSEAVDRNSAELRLAVSFDRVATTTGQPVRCKVKAERVGFRGYGMIMAEIGLPPGSQVDRSSLEVLLEDRSRYAIDRYEVNPDRVIFYLWPQAGGVEFEFAFTPRLALEAKSPASLLYDYYNPEALREVRPFEWVVNAPY